MRRERRLTAQRKIFSRTGRPRPNFRRIASFVVAACLAIPAIFSSPAAAFFGCCRGRQTLRDDFSLNDAVVFCRLIAEPGQGDNDRALFEVTEILKDTELLPKPTLLATAPHRFRTKMNSEGAGAEFLVFVALNEQGTALEWGEAVPVNDREMAYARGVATLPTLSEESESSTPPSRLKRLLPFLDARDPLIVQDLEYELETIPYSEIRAARHVLPTARLRQWIADPETCAGRLRYYFLLLSACGTKDDVPLVRSELRQSDLLFYASRDHGVACMVLLGGERALAEVEEKYFKPTKKPREFELGEIIERRTPLIGLALAAQHTETIEPERLIESFRLALAFPELTGDAANELARLEDWDSAPRLMEIYRGSVKQPESDWLRLSIVNYIRRSPRADAEQYLAELRELDPEMVANSEKHYPIREEFTGLVIVRGP